MSSRHRRVHSSRSSVHAFRPAAYSSSRIRFASRLLTRVPLLPRSSLFQTLLLLCSSTISSMVQLESSSRHGRTILQLSSGRPKIISGRRHLPYPASCRYHLETDWAHTRFLPRPVRAEMGEVYRARDSRLDRFLAVAVSRRSQRLAGWQTGGSMTRESCYWQLHIYSLTSGEL